MALASVDTVEARTASSGLLFSKSIPPNPQWAIINVLGEQGNKDDLRMISKVAKTHPFPEVRQHAKVTLAWVAAGMVSKSNPPAQLLASQLLEEVVKTEDCPFILENVSDWPKIPINFVVARLKDSDFSIRGRAAGILIKHIQDKDPLIQQTLKPALRNFINDPINSDRFPELVTAGRRALA